jgi:hypothetical protein
MNNEKLDAGAKQPTEPLRKELDDTRLLVKDLGTFFTVYLEDKFKAGGSITSFEKNAALIHMSSLIEQHNKKYDQKHLGGE